MFEQWSLTDVLAGAATVVAVAYMGFELSRSQHKLRALFNVLDGADATLTHELSDLVDSGALRPYSAVAAGWPHSTAGRWRTDTKRAGLSPTWVGRRNLRPRMHNT
jgi:hypothetical protein